MKAAQIIKSVNDSGAKYIRLIDTQGNVMIPSNTPKVTLEDRAKQIEKVLSSDIYPDGTYYLEIIQNIKSPGTRVPMYKGEPKVSDPVPVISDAKPNDFNNKIQFLEDKINSLCELLESDTDDEEVMQDHAPNIFETILPVIIPIADKYFNLQERKITLEENKAKQLPVINNDENFSTIYSYLQSLQSEVEVQAVLNSLKITNPDIYNKIVNSYVNES